MQGGGHGRDGQSLRRYHKRDVEGRGQQTVCEACPLGGMEGDWESLGRDVGARL